jgi:hypothetical protein
VIIEPTTDTTEYVLSNVKKQIQYVEITKKIHEKIVTMEMITERRIVKIIALLNVQQTFQKNQNAETE